MHLLRGIIQSIREELDDVEKYADAALRTRVDDAQLAAVYAELGMEEMKHAERLHKAAVDMIAKATSAGKEAPAAMKAIWEFEHAMMIEDMAHAKRILEMCKG